jgi:hypothetical protein
MNGRRWLAGTRGPAGTERLWGRATEKNEGESW